MAEKTNSVDTKSIKVTNLVRVFDVDTETQLFEHPPFCLDDLRLEGDVVLIKDHGLYCPATASREAQLSKCDTPTRVGHKHTTPPTAHSCTSSCVPNSTATPNLSIYSTIFYVPKSRPDS